MLDCQAVGSEIHRLRVVNGYSQDQLAAELYVSRQAVSRWELGQTMPSIDNLMELCRLFSASFEDILCLNRPVQLNPKDIFAGYERNYVIRNIINGKIEVTLDEVFGQFTGNERWLILRAVKEKKLKTSVDKLQPQLTQAEISYLESEVKNDER